MIFYKRHIGDYIRDTAHLSLLEHGAYARLLDLYYLKEAPLPAMPQAARLVGARSPAESKAVERVLQEFFQFTTDGWRHKRCDEEICAAQEKAQLNRENGKMGGRPKRNGSISEPTNNHDGFDSESELEAKKTLSKTPRLQDLNPKSANPPSAPEDFETRKTLFDLAKTILGASSGGLISKAISRTDEAHVAKVIGEMAAKPMADPRAYFVAATTPKERPRIVT